MIYLTNITPDDIVAHRHLFSMCNKMYIHVGEQINTLFQPLSLTSFLHPGLSIRFEHYAQEIQPTITYLQQHYNCIIGLDTFDLVFHFALIEQNTYHIYLLIYSEAWYQPPSHHLAFHIPFHHVCKLLQTQHVSFQDSILLPHIQYPTLLSSIHRYFHDQFPFNPQFKQLISKQHITNFPYIHLNTPPYINNALLSSVTSTPYVSTRYELDWLDVHFSENQFSYGFLYIHHHNFKLLEELLYQSSYICQHVFIITKKSSLLLPSKFATTNISLCSIN